MAEEQTRSAEMESLLRRFRLRLMDDNPLENLLNDQKEEFSNERLEGYLIEAQYHINEFPPTTHYKIKNFPQTSLLLDGAMIFALRARGLLHLRNQLSYNDAGFSVNLDDKTGQYSQQIQLIGNAYFRDLQQFKQTEGMYFHGVSSPYGWWNGWM